MDMPLISCEWLLSHLGEPGLVVLDATFCLPAQGRDAAAEFRAAHLPGALFFDIDLVADTDTTLPHMLPRPEQFAAAVGGMGIGNDTRVVVYDNNEFLASARVWWTFRAFGHDRVAVLDGGLKRWIATGGPVEAEIASPSLPTRFDAVYRPELVVALAQMREMAGRADVRIIDARSFGRFAGSEPEPRPGLRSGHIPGSRSLHYRRLIDDASGRMKSPDQLGEAFRAVGVDTDDRIVTSCGTGVTAATLALALARLGRWDIAVYDGSWTEWGGLPDTPIDVGPAGD
ncbi:MAG: 3-mercaptopyruvate sulfurtransferase [Methylotetracoccus sp.]